MPSPRDIEDQTGTEDSACSQWIKLVTQNRDFGSLGIDWLQYCGHGDPQGIDGNSYWSWRGVMRLVQERPEDFQKWRTVKRLLGEL